MSALHHALVGRSPEKEARRQTEARSAECKIYSGFPHNIRQRAASLYTANITHMEMTEAFRLKLYIKKKKSLTSYKN